MSHTGQQREVLLFVHSQSQLVTHIGEQVNFSITHTMFCPIKEYKDISRHVPLLLVILALFLSRQSPSFLPPHLSSLYLLQMVFSEE